MRLIRCLALAALVLAATPAAASAASAWSDAGQLATGRFSATLTALPDGSALLVGGDLTAERWSPATGSWSAAGANAVLREGHTATLLPDGDVLVAGGNNGSMLSDVERYDLATGTWSAAASMATGHGYGIAAPLPGGKVLVAGGNTSAAEVYDPVADTWTPTAPLSTPRTTASATTLPDGDVLVVGGTVAATAERYDVATGTWAPTGPMTTRRQFSGIVGLADGSVLVAGGIVVMEPTASSERYDPATNTWTLGPAMRQARQPVLQRMADGRVLAVGGDATAEIFDPATGRWTATEPSATSRFRVAADRLADGTVLVVGGAGTTGTQRYRHASAFTVTGAYFGDRAVGAAGAPAALVVRNTGLQRLIVTGTAITGAADFTVTSDGCTGTRVEPGASCRIDVAFHPGAAGSRTAQLRVNSDTGDAETAELAGTGIAAAAPKPPAVASASCARHSARAARCRFALPGATGWADVKVALKRGSRTLASGRVLAWKGRGSLKVRGARKLRGGRYTLVLRPRGRTPVTLPVALR